VTSDESTTPDPAELTHRLFETANVGDFNAMMRFFGSGSIWDVEPWGLGTHAGPAAIQRFIEGWIGSFDGYQVVIEEMLDLGNGVVFAVATQYGRSAHVRGELRLRYAPVFVWADSIVVTVTHYRDIDQARAAAKRLADG
jgi:SnoaL-like domain